MNPFDPTPENLEWARQQLAPIKRGLYNVLWGPLGERVIGPGLKGIADVAGSIPPGTPMPFPALAAIPLTAKMLNYSRAAAKLTNEPPGMTQVFEGMARNIAPGNRSLQPDMVQAALEEATELAKRKEITDPEQWRRLATVAGRGAMQRVAGEAMGTVHLPEAERQLASQLQRFEQDIYTKTGNKMSDEALAIKFNYERKKAGLPPVSSNEVRRFRGLEASGTEFGMTEKPKRGRTFEESLKAPELGPTQLEPFEQNLAPQQTPLSEISEGWHQATRSFPAIRKFGITSKQSQIAELHARGLTNQQIADQLGIKSLSQVQSSIDAVRSRLKGGLKPISGGSDVDVHGMFKKLGASYKGESEGLYWFDDPQTGSTLAIKITEATPEAIASKLAASRKAFAEAKSISGASGPEQPFFTPEGRQELGQLSKIQSSIYGGSQPSILKQPRGIEEVPIKVAGQEYNVPYGEYRAIDAYGMTPMSDYLPEPSINTESLMRGIEGMKPSGIVPQTDELKLLRLFRQYGLENQRFGQGQ